MSGFSPDHAGADVRVSPNFGPRRGPFRPDMIVLHYTGMASGEGAEAWLCDPASEVSSHYLVHKDGRIVQMVRESDRAWFPWKALHAAGIGHLVPAAPIRQGAALREGDQGAQVEELQSLLALYGYGLGITRIFDPATRIAVEAFQRHFRPRLVDGVADGSTIRTLKRLVASAAASLA